MKEQELVKGTLVWCWWKSRWLYYIGKTKSGKYIFSDLCDCITEVNKQTFEMFRPE